MLQTVRRSSAREQKRDTVYQMFIKVRKMRNQFLMGSERIYSDFRLGQFGSNTQNKTAFHQKKKERRKKKKEHSPTAPKHKGTARGKIKGKG